MVAAERWILQFAKAREPHCTGPQRHFNGVRPFLREGESFERDAMGAQVRERLRRLVDGNNGGRSR